MKQDEWEPVMKIEVLLLLLTFNHYTSLAPLHLNICFINFGMFISDWNMVFCIFTDDLQGSILVDR